MPQDAAFLIPFPSRMNAGAVSARGRHAKWVRQWRLVCGEEAELRYASSRFDDLAAYVYPDADAEGFDLALNVLGWFFLLDDQFDTPETGQRLAAVEACQQMILLLHREPGPVALSAPPLVAAFSSLWNAMCVGMSEQWRGRAAWDWVDYLAGNIAEVADRQAGTAVSYEQHLTVRRRSIGARPALLLSERTGHFEVPSLAFYSSHMEAMRAIVVDHIVLTNDVCSLEKDDARGDTNVVRLLMRKRRISRDQAVSALVRHVDGLLETFVELEAGLPRLCVTLGLTPTETSAVHRYADAMRAWIRGNYDWSRSSGRYAAQAADQVARNQTGHLNLQDLVSRLPTEDGPLDQ